jgi:serine/threonine protein kinase
VTHVAASSQFLNAFCDVDMRVCIYPNADEQNVLLGCDGRAKIGDFGVAHHFSDEVAR